MNNLIKDLMKLDLAKFSKPRSASNKVRSNQQSSQSTVVQECDMANMKNKAYSQR